MRTVAREFAVIDDSHWEGRHRCAACRMHRTLCLCSAIPTLATRTRVVLVLHQMEMHKTSNTGQLAMACLPNGETVLHGGPDVLVRDWSRMPQPVLLFPHPEARPLTDWRGSEQPVTLIVPDATWSQATKTRRRVPGLQDVPCAVLPPERPSRYLLRTSLKSGRISTLEAIARALEVLEEDGTALRDRMEHLVAMMVDRTRWASGRLCEAEVTGGIPAQARVYDGASVGPERGPRG